MVTPNGAGAHQQADDQQEVPFAPAPLIDLTTVAPPPPGQMAQAIAQTAPPGSVPESPQAATGQQQQTASSSSAPMPSAAPTPSPPTHADLENNIVNKIMAQMTAQFNLMDLREQQQRLFQEAQINTP